MLKLKKRTEIILRLSAAHLVQVEAALEQAVTGAKVLIHVEPHVKAKGDISESDAVII